MRQRDNHLPLVREQYEALPYPACDPEDDRKRLAQTWLEDLAMINHYCFAGRQSFRSSFRALVAGGGTGDTTAHRSCTWTSARRGPAQRPQGRRRGPVRPAAALAGPLVFRG